jgi:hypothetical protein
VTKLEVKIDCWTDGAIKVQYNMDWFSYFLEKEKAGLELVFPMGSNCMCSV